MGELRLIQPPAEQMPPNDPALEKAVLGACMLNAECVADIVEILTARAFFFPAHGLLWTAIASLYAQRCPIDMLTVTQECKRRESLSTVGGALYISQLTNNVTGTGTVNVVYHAHLILKMFVSREAIRIASELRERAFEPALDPFDLLAGAGSEIRMLNEFGIKQARPMSEIMTDAVDNRSPDRGICFGFPAIDAHMRLEPGTVTIIGARPGMGKTAFMLSSAWRQAQDGHRPYVVEMEMKEVNLATRLVCGECGIPVWKKKRRLLDQHDEAKMSKWHVDNGGVTARMLVDETASMRVSALAARLDRAKRKQQIDVVWIDYIGLLQPSEKQRPGYDRMTAISNELRVLAKELDLPFAVLAQLNRPMKGAAVKRPGLTDLRDSGEIEQDAEAVAFLHRPKYYDMAADDTVEYIRAKNRDGDDGMDELWFDAPGVRMLDKPVFADAPKYTVPPDNRIEKDQDDVAPF